MNKMIYTLAFSGLLALNLNAQNTYSFEATEGYTLGTLHEQNGWEVTEGSDGILQNQIITDEKASDGSFSFFNGYEADFDPLWFPVFGASKIFDTPMSSEKFSISYDVMPTGKGESDFELALFTVIEDEYYYLGYFGMENRGGVYMNSEYAVSPEDAYKRIDEVWTENEWTSVKIEIEGATMSFYVNEELMHSIELESNLDVFGFNMLHNNYGHSAYYDNFKINGGDLSIKEVDATTIALYPNPTTDFLHIQSAEKVASVAVYSVQGQKVLATENVEKINVQSLSAGVYWVEIKTVDGKISNKKFIKK